MPENIHDKGYKRILSQKAMFLQLLKRFLNNSWLESVEERDLELINKEFIPTDYQEKEADLVYKISRGDKECYYVYVLLELQSKVDYTMPFRLLVYMVELMKHIFANTPKKERERKDFRMPPVLPIVLYNGKRPWTAVREFRNYYRDGQIFGERLIDFVYSLIDINAQDESYLLEVNTLLENIFLLDRSRDRETLERALKLTARRLKKLERAEQAELAVWVKQVLYKKVGKEGNEELIEEVIEGWKKGDEAKMTYGIEVAFDHERQEGRKEGRQEGRKEGIEQVAKELLALNIDIETIKKATGLEVEELLKLERKQ